MGLVEYTPLQPGTTSSADADAIFTAIAAETATADSANFAEEGLDKGSMESAIQSEAAFTQVAEETHSTQALTTSWAVLNFGTAMTSGAITVASDEILHAEFSVEFLSNATQAGVPTDGRVFVQLWYDDGTPTAFADSLQLIWTPSNGGRDGRVRTQLKLDGPLTLSYVRAEIKDAGGNDVTVQMDNAVLSGRLYKRH